MYHLLTLTIIQHSLNFVKEKVYHFLNFFNFLLDDINDILYTKVGVITVTTEQMLKMALSFNGISQAELARRIGTTPSNLNQKVKRNTLTREDLEQIASAMDAEFVCHFRFKDGTEI